MWNSERKQMLCIFGSFITIFYISSCEFLHFVSLVDYSPHAATWHMALLHVFIKRQPIKTLTEHSSTRYTQQMKRKKLAAYLCYVLTM